MRIKVDQKARDFLRESLKDIKKENPLANTRTNQHIFNRILLLADFPYSGVETHKKGVYEALENKYKYRIFYKIYPTTNTLHVIAIFKQVMHSKNTLKMFID
ncbi:MAG: type II toxin-antitoxin system RelE/ParE family toxin [Magnetococcales bacterium]|nr:type II toxin-antitoxin system RelE/ParE family toxin [Magnetococcales bacterium]